MSIILGFISSRKKEKDKETYYHPIITVVSEVLKICPNITGIKMTTWE